MKLFTLLIIALLLLQAFVVHNDAVNAPANVQIDEGSDLIAIDKKHHHKKINCGQACSRRCKQSSRKNVCHRACRTCCARCRCVPPGTYGNKEKCPCYARLRTHGNRLKCP